MSIQSIAKQVFSVGINQHVRITSQFRECLNLMENTNYNLFITGKAGTGKSTLIRYFKNSTQKKVIILAPTGLAAVNIQGQTIHSFFKFPPKLLTKEEIKENPNSDMYKSLDSIIIDEASMMRADVFDAIDRFLRINGKSKDKPFGGVQIILSGDLYQLPPVITREESSVFDQLYSGPYFFNAQAFSDIFEFIELKTIFRQKDQEFIKILNAIREGVVSEKLLEPVNRQVKGTLLEDHIILTTTNHSAETINTLKLNLLNSLEFIFPASVEGQFSTEERNLPVALELRLKKGARVLFIKNDSLGRWVNGSLGIVEEVSENSIRVRLDKNEEVVDVGLEIWENNRYRFDPANNQVYEESIGRIKQYPLKLAWAITIHKSQGMTFDNMCLDFRQSSFAHGQTYVALSRCRSLAGIILTKAIGINDILVDRRIVEFMHEKGASKYS